MRMYKGFVVFENTLMTWGAKARSFGFFLAVPKSQQELFLKHVRQVIDAAVKTLWVQDGTDKGYFAVRNRTHLGANWKINIPMIRWGQAWMFNALATVLNYVRS